MLNLRQNSSLAAAFAAIIAVPTDHVAAQSDTLPRTPVPWEVAAPTFFAVSVADLDASSDWYGQVLGVTPVRDVASRDGRSRARLLRRDGLVVELIDYTGSVGVSDVLGTGAHRFRMQGPVKLGLYVLDIDGVRNWLQRNAVDMDIRVSVDQILRARTFVFRDLDGNRIQVFEDCGGECSDN